MTETIDPAYTLDTYQEQAAEFAVYPQGSFYPVFGLGEETGEVLGLFAEAINNKGTVDLVKVKKELGDVLWHLSQIANDNDFSLSEIAALNIAKLTDRKKRDVIIGSGDER
jgi:NTP pyrophosphatase (non-canonical NTP hydrolase)|tara:strand:+ start:11647 stop:11979 length:333 start_codon:yes stop_codon:yes gene_type:complete